LEEETYVGPGISSEMKKSAQRDANIVRWL